MVVAAYAIEKSYFGASGVPVRGEHKQKRILLFDDREFVLVLN